MNQPWEEILEKARATQDKSWLAEHLPELCTDPTLKDTTRLRILGNAIANSDENRQFLYKSGFVKKLLVPEALNIAVLMNYCIDFPQGCEQLMGEYAQDLIEMLIATSEDSRTSAKQLCSVLAVELDFDEANLQVRRDIVLHGFIEFILVDESLEIDDKILANFPQIYAYALAREDNLADATQVIGNITSHSNFTLEVAANIEPAESPVFFIVLANLTGRLAQLPPVLLKYPNSVEQVLDFVATGEDEDEFFSCAHFLRNAARVEAEATKMAKHEALRIVLEDVLESNYAEVGIQLLGLVGQYVPCFEYVDMLESVAEDPSVNAALLTTYSQLCYPLGTGAEASDAELVTLGDKIIGLLESTPSLEQTANLWLKGSKALALLSRHMTMPSIKHLEESAFDAPEIKQNFALIESEDKQDKQE